MKWVINTCLLAKRYRDTEALRSLDLRVPKSSLFGFLGPNGAGKTTTIKLLLGLIRPTSGTATVFGHNIERDSLAIRSRVGYLPQDPRFYEFMTARQILRHAASFYYEGPKAVIEQRVADTLELVGLTNKADRTIRTFSGGERQRVGIGQAQVHHPDLLILDEPAASLDPVGRRDVLEVMKSLRDANGTTIFYCTHILDDVQRVSDAVAILNHGELVSHGPIEGLLGDSRGTAYAVTIKGDAEAAYERVSSQDWVASIQAQRRNGSTLWTVNVTDTGAAEARLLRLLLADERLVVTSFGQKAYELEDIFLNIVEGSGNDCR